MAYFNIIINNLLRRTPLTSNSDVVECEHEM